MSAEQDMTKKIRDAIKSTMAPRPLTMSEVVVALRNGPSPSEEQTVVALIVMGVPVCTARGIVTGEVDCSGSRWSRFVVMGLLEDDIAPAFEADRIEANGVGADRQPVHQPIWVGQVDPLCEDLVAEMLSR